MFAAFNPESGMTCRRFALIAIWVVTSHIVSAQTKETLPEIVRLYGPAPIHTVRMLELLPATLDELVPKADLIVHGVVTGAQTYLSENQADLYTDYTISPIRFLFQRRAVQVKTPGLAPPIIVKKWGGEMIIDSVPVKLEHEQFRAFKTGERILLVLRFDDASGKYVTLGGAVFSVLDGRIQPILDHPRHDVFRGMSIDEFASLLSQTKSGR